MAESQKDFAARVNHLLLQIVTYPFPIDYQTVEMKDDEHCYLQVKYVDHNKETHTGRKWLLSKHMTTGEIIQTAFLAALAFMEHELREAFRYKDVAILGPHISPDSLVLHAKDVQIREPECTEASKQSAAGVGDGNKTRPAREVPETETGEIIRDGDTG